MAQMIGLNCEHCSSPDLIFIKNLGSYKYFRCNNCNSLNVLPPDGYVINLDYKECENCGTMNGPDARVCQNCGTQIRYACSNCDRLIDLDATFCPYCEIHIQNYLEEQKHRQAEEKQAAGVRRIQKLESEILLLQSSIGSKEGNIRQARRKIDTIRKSRRKLYYFGKTGLSEEEKLIYSQLSTGNGCGTKVVAVVLAMTTLSLSSQLFIALTATSFYALQPASSSHNEQFLSATLGLCISVFLAIGVGWLVYNLIMMLARQKSVDHLASEQERWLRDLQAEKQEIKKKLERLQRELAVAIR